MTKKRFISAAGLVSGLFGWIAVGFVMGSVWQADRSSELPSSFSGRDLACVQVLANGGVARDCDRMYNMEFSLASSDRLDHARR